MKRSLPSLLLLAFALIISYQAHADDRNLLPKYGNSPKESWQIESDKVFIAGMDEEYHGDRKKASLDMAMRGWQYLRGGDPEGAMRRFNQSWLLNSRNGTALWGMAAVEADLGKLDEALKLFSEAEPLVGEDLNFAIDHTRVIGLAGVQKKDDALLKEAFVRFDHIYQKSPQNFLNLQNWAMTLLGAGRYPEAWAKVRLAEATPNKGQLDSHFIAALTEKMAKPEH